MSPVYVYVMNKMFGHKVGVWTVCLNRSSWCAFVSAHTPPTKKIGAQYLKSFYS